MGVGHPAAVVPELITPRKQLPGQPAARGELPFRLGRQTFAGPFRVGERIGVGHVHHREPLFAGDRAIRAERVAPARAFDVRPPLVRIGKRNGVFRRREDHRTRRPGSRPELRENLQGAVSARRRSRNQSPSRSARIVRSSLRSRPSRSRRRRPGVSAANRSWPASRRRRGQSGGACAPIENSPPGIHTIPSGAGRGAERRFSTVGNNRADGTASGAGGLARVVASARTTEPTIGTRATPNHVRLLRFGTDAIARERRLLI